MDEVDAWVEEQAESRRIGKREFLRKMRLAWTPCFDGCCAQFLADGDYVWDEFQDEYSFRSGCRFGKKCRYAHPCVTISFDGVATATISHGFDKFRTACMEADAWPHSEFEYRSDEGTTVRELRTRLLTKLQRHLVKVAPGALEASDAKYLADQATSQQTEEAPQLREPFTRFGEVVTALGLRCDLLTLYHLRQVSIDARDAARGAATYRLRRATFRVHPLVDGTCRTGECATDGLIGDSEVESIDGDMYDGGFGVTLYARKTKPIPLAFRRWTGTGAGVFAPKSNDALFHWESRRLWEETEEYRGQQLKVFWLPAPEDGVVPRQRRNMYEDRLPDLGILVAKIRLGRVPETGTKTTRSGVAVRYDVVEAYADGDESDEDSHLAFRGRARVVEMALEFGTLVAHAATPANPDVRSLNTKLRQDQQVRPLDDEEWAYIKSVDQARDGRIRVPQL